MHRHQYSKSSSIHNFILKVQQVLGSHKLNGHAHFWPSSLKNHEMTFSFPEFASACKISVQSIYSFLRNSQLVRALWPDEACSFLTMSTQNVFDQLLIYVSLHQHAKKSYLFILEIRLIKMSYNLIGWEHFDPYLRKRKCSLIRNLCSSISNEITFHYRTNSVKIYD